MGTGPRCPSYQVLVIGIGNLLMGDDGGVGMQAVQQLLENKLPPLV